MSTEMLSTGMPEVFENESSFVYRKIVIGDVRAAIGTNKQISSINMRLSGQINKIGAIYQRKELKRKFCYRIPK